MTRSRSAARIRQQGIASLLVAIFLISGVLFILVQTLGIVGTRATDTSQQMDSTAALLLAESGMQRAQAIIGTAAAGNMTNADCTGVVGSTTYSLGRGTFTYGTPISTPATCNSTVGCNTCQVSVTGAVGSTSRTISQTFNLVNVNGTTGKGTTVTMVLKNTYSVPAVALFNLAWKRQGSGGNSASTLTTCGVGCVMRWNVESSNGNPSAGGMGTTVDIAANTLSQVVTQVISLSRDYVEVGALFPSVNASAPLKIGSYWNEGETTANSGASGSTNSGVAGGGTCIAAPNPSNGVAQSCTQWCTGADTLVFGVSARSATAADQLTAVTFNTSGTPSQNVALTRTVHFPNTDGTIANASGLVYSEVWYASNPDYMSGSADAKATSYPKALFGTAGANANLSAAIPNNSTTMSVASLVDSNSKICVGDLLTTASGTNRFATGTRVTATPSGLTCNNAAGTYTFDLQSTGNMNAGTIPAASSTNLIVQSQTGANFAAGATSNGAVTIASGPVSSIYTLSAAANVPTLTAIGQGTAASTITVPTGSTVPSVGTRVALYSLATGGVGALAAATTVTSTTTNTFTLSAAPTTAVIGGVICGGACAFFNGPSSTSSVTNFTITRSAGTAQWAGGFVCLKGVDASLIIPVTSSSTNANRWQEVVQ